MAATVIICIVIAVIIILGIRNYRKNLKSGCCGSDSDAATKKIRVKDRDLSHYPYKKVLMISGMTCQDCAARVQNALNSLDGVLSKVYFGQKKAVVHMKEEVPDELLRKTVAEAGYMIVSIEAGPQY